MMVVKIFWPWVYGKSRVRRKNGNKTHFMVNNHIAIIRMFHKPAIAEEIEMTTQNATMCYDS